VIEPDAALLGRAGRLLGERLVLGAIAAPLAAVQALAAAMRRVPAQEGWAAHVRETIAWRPAGWAALAGAPEGPIHPATLCHAINAALDGQRGRHLRLRRRRGRAVGPIDDPARPGASPTASPARSASAPPSPSARGPRPTAPPSP
jgi:hypothetical protein